jgi:hypothetical protein
MAWISYDAHDVVTIISSGQEVASVVRFSMRNEAVGWDDDGVMICRTLLAGRYVKGLFVVTTKSGGSKMPTQQQSSKVVCIYTREHLNYGSERDLCEIDMTLYREDLHDRVMGSRFDLAARVGRSTYKTWDLSCSCH